MQTWRGYGRLPQASGRKRLEGQCLELEEASDPAYWRQRKVQKCDEEGVAS